jgi:hypothetical protein
MMVHKRKFNSMVEYLCGAKFSGSCFGNDDTTQVSCSRCLKIAAARDCEDCGGSLPNCDCDGMREMLESGLEMTGTI